jgi:hypothetical protein
MRLYCNKTFQQANISTKPFSQCTQVVHLSCYFNVTQTKMTEKVSGETKNSVIYTKNMSLTVNKIKIQNILLIETRKYNGITLYICLFTQYRQILNIVP